MVVRQSSLWVSVLVAASGTALSLAVFWGVLRNSQSHEREHFELVADELLASMADTILDSTATTLFLGDFLHHYDRHRQDFRSFASAALARYPAIRAVMWIPRVRADQRGAHEAAASSVCDAGAPISDRGAEGSMVPAPQRSEYFPICYVEPQHDNQALVGYDLASDPVLSAALRDAAASGEARATPRFALLREAGDRDQILVVVPLYGEPPPSEAEDLRRDVLTGFGVGVLGAAQLVSNGISVNVDIFDLSAPETEQRLYPDFSVRALADLQRGLNRTRTVDVAGRTWLLVATPAAGQQPRHDTTHWHVLALCLMITLLLTTTISQRMNRNTERRQMEERAKVELVEKEEQVRLVLESSAQAIYAIDRDGKITLCNTEAWRTLGYDDSHELLGKPSHSLFHHSRADGAPYPAEECAAHLAVQAGQIANVSDEVFWRKDGSPVRVEYTVRPMRSHGMVVGAVIAFSDITEKLKVESALRHAQKISALSSLTGGLAHEINNMLLPILSLVGLTMKELPPETRARKRMEKVVEAAGRAQALVARMMSFAGQEGEVIERIDVGVAVAGALDLVRSAVPATVELELAVDPAAGAVLAAAKDIQTVLMNLVSNAVDALEGRSGRLRIAAHRIHADPALMDRVAGLRQDTYVRLAVSDTGRGMDEKTRERVFEPFFTTKAVGTGTGLGLAVVHGIVVSRRGAIAVSSAPGRGTSVEVFLPAAD